MFGYLVDPLVFAGIFLCAVVVTAHSRRKVLATHQDSLSEAESKKGEEDRPAKYKKDKKEKKKKKHKKGSAQKRKKLLK